MRKGRTSKKLAVGEVGLSKPLNSAASSVTSARARAEEGRVAGQEERLVAGRGKAAFPFML